MLWRSSQVAGFRALFTSPFLGAETAQSRGRRVMDFLVEQLVSMV